MTMIEAHLPDNWQDLENRVAQILMECGYEVQVQRNVSLARGDACIDVWADDHSSPQNIIAVECKHWARPATKSVVHAFRTVVGDSGANTGLLVSSAGFQEGAIRAADYSNVRLLDWNEFQSMFAIRWFKTHMSPTLAECTDALHEYTELVNSRIFRKANTLSIELQEQFVILRRRHWPLAVLNLTLRPEFGELLRGERLRPDQSPWPSLPLRANSQTSSEIDYNENLPDDVLDATALRPFMDTLVEHSQRAISEFDELFGERA
ncbi:hypothetical protein DMC64_18565 [Amycolatopsis sp. WAC 04197]|uniref:restriction endonuclease n=1 Tax=Amycolatopsis sp. WAC 04197 TaxID=2203199 RepID=UPI000F7B6E1A|nr:restriction endonuclease [Amycolatopsis sp. WAC 04197]RSN44891.1 hypothetical protein DMC64_18565 [Amycolatopsis sp. WAC 04197]